MRTKPEYRSLGEDRSTYTTNSSVRQMKQSDTTRDKVKSGGGSGIVALGLLAGAAAGALAGVLLAPDKGTATRKKVVNSASKLGDQVNKGYTATKSKVGSWSWTSRKKEPYVNPNLSKNQQGGAMQSSPYNDNSNWNNSEVNRMVNDARRTPGL